MNTAVFQFQDDRPELSALQAFKLACVLGLHVAPITWIAHTQLDTQPDSAPTRLDDPTVEIPAPEIPKSVMETPKPLPQTAKPIRRLDPVTPPPLLTAEPCAGLPSLVTHIA